MRSRTVRTVDGRQFRDANGSGTVDRYEDWRLPVEVHVDDLVSFALARTLQAVIDNEPDVPGYRAADSLYPCTFGFTY